MLRGRLHIFTAVIALFLASVPAHTQSGGCGLSAEYADPCNLDSGGDPTAVGGPHGECQRCVIGDDGSVSCKNRYNYQSQWPEYYGCSVVTHCYYDGYQGWYCEVSCDGTPCYSA